MMGRSRKDKHKKKLNPLGERLVAEGIITRGQLEEALAHQKGNSEPLGQTLVRLGYVTDSQLNPFLGNGNGRYPVAPLELDQLDSPALVEFYQLQSRIKFALFSDRPVRTILLTSALPSEGKSLCTTYMGIVTAVTLGKRVLIVDCDLRHPCIHRVFHLPNLFGLTDVLVDSIPTEKAIQRTKLEHLDVLTSGTRVSNPTSLISSAKLEGLLDELSGEYELIFLDSPPVLITPDATMLGTSTHGTILVVQANSSRMKDTKKALGKLRMSGINVMGVLLNRYEEKGKEYYYGEYYRTKTGAETE